MKKQTEIEKTISKINLYRSANKLAFFVGAGISRLSGYPSWSELILSMADEIGYSFHKLNCNNKPILSSEDFLKIPQIYYNSKGKSKYFQKVHSQLDAKKEPNKIHKLIMRINPYHILTTNYDDLLEQSANMFAINYSLINSDKKVSKAATQRYIIKVHGDFEEDNFVLKESDYLNYEQNFTLVSTIMKTIIASHLIVFIGYQLSDYNIKLILNWVQNVQGNTFIKPIFIYTDSEKLSDSEINYYKKRGLQIICAYDLCSSESFEERYSTVLNKILISEKLPADINFKSVINFTYKKLYPLNEINYLRATDLISIFDNQSIDKANIINIKQEFPLFEILFAPNNQKDNISSEHSNKLNYIISRIEKSGVAGYHTKTYTHRFSTKKQIDNNVFWGNYEEIQNGLNKYGNSIPDLYNKAYDLCILGNIEGAYYIYTNLLYQCKEEGKWIYYFFTQINLRYLVQLINYIKRMTKGFYAFLNWGKEFEQFTPELLDDIQLHQAFIDLPATIKKYSFLSRLSSNNYYADDIVKLYEKNYKITSGIANETITLIGTASYDASEILMKDALNFIYNNKLLFSLFSEHKKFVQTTMSTYLKGKFARISMPPNEADSFTIKNINLTCQDLLLLIKNFNSKELSLLINEINFLKFKIDELEQQKFENYINYSIDFFKKNFTQKLTGNRLNMYILIREGIKNMCYLAYFFINSKNTAKKYINFFMQDMSEELLEFSERLGILKRIKTITSEFDDIIMDSVNNMLINKVNYCLENENPNLLSKWQLIINSYCQWIHETFPDYISKELTQIYSGKTFSENMQTFLYNLLPIISTQNM